MNFFVTFSPGMVTNRTYLLSFKQGNDGLCRKFKSGLKQLSDFPVAGRERKLRLQEPAGLQSWEKSATRWRIEAITLIIIPWDGIILLIVWCRDFWGITNVFPGVSGGKESACNAGDPGSILG